ncbi:alpha-glucosidase [Secundilactobacillus folii]|uniref:Alpha-glucosidase n=1 Tax=Secundilactobacillus folii TaxID=2678357 RepID=A0A7X3C288_9LACO|nr:alpha-glucosidase [Secundilactobacillus folii]MTV81227.1 alpha-glucosidase [Secundilactobacillus folii]
MTTDQLQQLNIIQDKLVYHQIVLFNQLTSFPLASLGRGTASVQMHRGNFEMRDTLSEKIPLQTIKITQNKSDWTLLLGHESIAYLSLKFLLSAQDRLVVTPTILKGNWNRLWLRLNAQANEQIYGCGEQLSYFDLRGHHFPLWSSEPGIGRNKHTLTTFQADQEHAGGDYYTTNYPEATFISSQKYYCHADTYTYADFDFRAPDHHELQFWGIPTKLTFETATDFESLTSKLSRLLGRTRGLPDWTNNGVILGLQGGTKRVNEIKTRLEAHGVKIAGLWCQDWEGVRMTSFGKRLFWDWQPDTSLYPNLKDQINAWRQSGIRFLGYINPYVASDSALFKIGTHNGYFAKNKAGDVYLVDFGEFNCGVVDFTNPTAFEWFKQLIQQRLINEGFAGWMADFGEYLPTDVVLFDHSDPMARHNQWPVLWAKCNYEAVRASPNADQLLYFMRAGATGSQHYNQLLWAGDQSVNWSRDDGLIFTIPAALSSGLIGNSLSHSDIGGYTSMYGNVRTKELFMRWAEMAAFTPIMRTHEGNRPDQNFQVYDDPEAMNHLAKCTDWFVTLSPYRQAVVRDAVKLGLPAQRPLMMYYDDSQAMRCQSEYLFGRDLLVAPVAQPAQKTWPVFLPDDQWVHLWSGKAYGSGTHQVAAPLGQPPVFYRQQSPYTKLFQTLGGLQ